jgi:hypothetical protein
VLERLPQGRGRQRKKLSEVARHAALGQLVDDQAAQQEVSEVDAALAAFGLVAAVTVDPPDELYLWPENVPTWNLFQALSTQWLVGMGGATGLNYQSVNIVMDHRRVARRDRQRVFEEIQAMERATLQAWSEKKK